MRGRRTFGDRMWLFGDMLHWTQTIPLLAIALWCGTRGIGYLPELKPDLLPGGLQLLVTGFGGGYWVTVYAVLWLATAAMALAALFSDRLAVVAYLPAMAMGSLAGTAYTLSWLQSFANDTSGANRDWVTAGSYIAPVMLMVVHVYYNRARQRAVSLLQHAEPVLPPSRPAAEITEEFRSLVAATLEAFPARVHERWWQDWLAADPDARQRMETGVLAEWSGQADAPTQGDEQ